MKKKQQQRLLSVLVSGAVLLSGSAAFAEEQEFNLDEYVVTASRMPVKKTETAASVTVVTREEIEKSGAVSVPDILKKTTVTMQNDRTASVPTINGDVRVLVLVDGREVNWKGGGMHMGQSGANLDYLPSVDSIERVEIVRGPASALYGSDAVGGVINIITRKSSEPVTRYSAEGGSWGLRRYKLTTENKVGDFSYRINFERERQDDYHYKRSDGQDARALNTALDQDKLGIRLDKEFGNDRSLTLTIDHTDGRKGFNVMPDAILFAKSGGSTNYFANIVQPYVENNVALTYRWNQGEKNNNFIRVYRNYLTYNYDRHMDYTYPDYYFNGLSYTNQADGAEWQQTWQLSDTYTLLGGASWREVTADSVEYPISFMGVQGYNYSDKKISNRAFFLENNWRLPKNWSVTAGVRYDDYTLFGDKTTARITANRELNQNTNVFASWGQIFKTPFIADVYGGGFMVPNLNLKPETGDVITLGMNTRLAAGTELQASVFSSRLNDALDYIMVGTNKYQWQNIAELKRRGLDISLKRRLSPQWQVTAGYSYVKVEEQGATEREEFNNNEPHGYRLGLQYGQDKWDADFALRGATGRDLRAFTSSDYWVVDLGVKYQINPATRLYLKVYNLTDEAYELHGSYGDASGFTGLYPMAGRQIVIGIDQRI
ncbi:TonB-dependent siderophore receptor [Sporomusa sp. KB1]|jgi:vitamin B12 transporter|uniref:TonB-dependent receptor plug domain-containing protein n=1 Tax=Sporomusa sp. KB1 TaxID=943346 RepID=UPI0011A0E62F|nr:TonB-dependent receptor [Sporomusa sp. KB1]TWH49186.1 vitamin B12 transporter [Sporomusa sp. KB1]